MSEGGSCQNLKAQPAFAYKEATLPGKDQYYKGRGQIRFAQGNTLGDGLQTLELWIPRLQPIQFRSRQLLKCMSTSINTHGFFVHLC